MAKTLNKNPNSHLSGIPRGGYSANKQARKPVKADSLREKRRAPRAVNTAEKPQKLPTAPALAADRQAPPRLLTLPGMPDSKPAAREPDGTLRIAAPPGETEAETAARIMLNPATQNAFIAKIFTEGKIDATKGTKLTGPLDFPACVEVKVQAIERLKRGDLSDGKHMLLTQAHALQAIFHEMARRAALNMGEYLGPTETYLRLAFKAQSQCRATIETLAEIESPRPIFINPKQVNHANGNQQVNNAGGPQQVNNGALSQPTPLAIENEAETIARGEKSLSSNEVLQGEGVTVAV